MLADVLYLHEQSVQYNIATTDYTVRSIFRALKAGQVILYGQETTVATAGGVPTAATAHLNDAYTWYGITPP